MVKKCNRAIPKESEHIDKFQVRVFGGEITGTAHLLAALLWLLTWLLFLLFFLISQQQQQCLAFALLRLLNVYVKRAVAAAAAPISINNY